MERAERDRLRKMHRDLQSALLAKEESVARGDFECASGAGPRIHHLRRELGKAAANALIPLLDERDRLEAALQKIAAGMGNLSLKAMGRPDGVSGPNDGKARAIYLERFVRIAREALAGKREVQP